MDSLNNYRDHYGRFHDKPVTENNPIPSNNGWIYTAYAKKLGFYISSITNGAGEYCSLMLVRTPNKFTPPISRDEILGLAYLGYLKPEHLEGWNFSPFDRPRLNLFILVKQLLESRGKHRNYFWQNNLDQMYHIAFSVPLTDRAFILECWGETKSIRYLFYKFVANIDKRSKKENGIRFLKYGKSRSAMLEEFPEDHPFRY